MSPRKPLSAEWVTLKLLLTSLLYSCCKTCSTGAHNETVKKLTLFSAFDRTTAFALFNGHSSEQNAIKSTLSRHFINETRYNSTGGSSLYLVSENESLNATFSMFLRPKQTREVFNYLPQRLRSNSSQLHHSIQIENSTALFFAKSRNLIGTIGTAGIGPKQVQVFQSNTVSLC